MARREAWRNPLILESVNRQIRGSPQGITFNKLLHSHQALISKDSTLRRLLQVLIASGSVSRTELSPSSLKDHRWANLKHRPVLYKKLHPNPTIEFGVRAYLHHGVSFDYDPSLPYHSILEETDWTGLSRASLAQEDRQTVPMASLEDLLVHALTEWNSRASTILRPLSIMLYGPRKFDGTYLSQRASGKGVTRLLQEFQASFKEAFLRIRPGNLARRPNLLKARNLVLENHPELRWVKARPLLQEEEILDLTNKEALSH